MGASSGSAQPRRDFVTAFANAISALSAQSSPEEILAQVPQILVRDFGSVRSELWLWDDLSNSGYLTHAAGAEVQHRRDFITRGSGTLGRAIETKSPQENVGLAESGLELSNSAELDTISVFPLMSKGPVVAVLANYTAASADDETRAWWRAYSEIAAMSVQRAISDEQSRKQIQQLSVLFEAARLLNSTFDLPELLELILQIARTEVKADRGTVFLVDKQRKELWSVIAQGLESQEIRIPFGKGVAGHVAQTGEILNAIDAYELPFFDRSFDQKFGYHTKSLLCLPIRHRSGEIVGVLQLLNQANGAFTNQHEEFLSKLSGHMAMALENARLHRDAIDRQRMERDVAVARQIQRSLLPEHPPVVPGYDLAVQTEPCSQSVGDYYDFLDLGPQTLLLVMASVQGRGVASSLLLAKLQATLKALVMHLHSLEVLMLSLNEIMFAETKGKKPLTCFLGVIDTRRNGLYYINAGHPAPIIVRDAGEVEELVSGGPAVGVSAQTDYRRGTVQFSKGNVLACYTQAIADARNVEGKPLEISGLAELLKTHRERPAQQIVDSTLTSIAEFARGSTQSNDWVLLAIKVTNPAPVEPAE